MGVSVTSIRVSRLHYPVTVLGYGRRVGIWLQGCSIGCPGCISRDTWDPSGGTPTTVSAVVEQVRAWAERGIDGVTISGGEPFDQPDALRALLGELSRWRGQAGLDFDILCYSGYPERRLRERHASALAVLDALVPEPFRPANGPGGRWMGSANQRLVALSERGRQRYGMPPTAGTAAMQVVVDDDQVWFIGVPRPGDMESLERLLSAHGVELGGVSWR